MQKMVEDGTAKDGGDAYVQLHQRYPDLVERYKQERQQRRPVRKAPPLDYSQRLAALAKQEPFPLTVPAPTSGYADYTAMVDAYMRQHPGVSKGAAERAVMELDGGRQAFERHRQEMIFGRQG
jgi:hypothetical protein